jgi:ribosomal protein L21E
MKKAQKLAKVGKVMREYKEGTLHSGKKGPVVKSRKQAIAIALSEAKMAKPKMMKKSGARGR